MTPDTETAITTQPAPVAAPAPPPEDRRVSIAQLALLPESDHKTAWINAVVEADSARQTYAQDMAWARQFALSGKFEDLKGATAEQAIATAMTKIALGRSWGFLPADSMRHIYFVNGRPAVENDIIASKLYQAGYDWDIEWMEEKATHKGNPCVKCVGCRLWLKKWNAAQQKYLPMLDRNGEPVSVAFTEYDADTALIWEKGKEIPLSQKSNFKNWARDMYYWKTISRVRKYHAPHVLRGGMSREEATEVMPADLRPDQMPPELQAGPPVDEYPQPSRLRDRILQHEGFTQDPETEEGQQMELGE